MSMLSLRINILHLDYLAVIVGTTEVMSKRHFPAFVTEFY